jgi:hypothetical protein
MNNIEPLLDNTLILSKTDNIEFIINKPQKEKIILSSTDKPHEGNGNAYYTIMQNNNKITIYYRGLNIPNFNTLTEVCMGKEYTCYAESDDGLNFIKKDNNILLHDGASHNLFPLYLNNELHAIGGTQFTNDGLILLKYHNDCFTKVRKLLDGKQLLQGQCHPNHFDTHNVVLYDEQNKQYNIYIRYNGKLKRQIQYTITTDFLHFTKFNMLQYVNFNSHIYNPNIFYYPNSKYFISFPTSHIQENFIKKGMFGFSKDGYNFKILDFNVCDDINISYMVAHGMILSTINNKMYIYIHELDTANLICYSYELHRIGSIKCKDIGTITLGLFNIVSDNFKLNYKTKENGYIKVYLYNMDDLLLSESENLCGNEFSKPIIWTNNIILSNEIKYKLKFELNNASLYSLVL